MLEIFEDRVNRLTSYKVLHGFALGLVSIFIPIFVAQQGFSPSIIFSFLLVDVAAFTLVALPVGWLVSRMGVKSSLLASSLLYVLVFVFIQSLTLNLKLIGVLGVLIGLAKAFHWIPVNTEFTVGSEKDDRGESYGKLEGIPALIGPFAPLIGAAVMTYIGFNVLVTVSLFFAFTSILPLMLGDGTQRPEFSLDGLKDFNQCDLWILYFLDGFATTAYVFIFPLFIYYVIGGTINVGSAKTLMAIGAGLFSIAAGKISDRISQKDLLLAGASASAVIYLLVPALGNPINAFALSFVAGLTYTVYTIPLVSIVADIAEQENILGFFSIREVFQGIGKVAVVSVTVYLILNRSMEIAFRITFYLAAISVIALALVSRKVEERR